MNTLLESIISSKLDGVLFKAEYLLHQAEKDVDAYSQAVNEIALMLCCINNPVKRDSYMQQLAKKHRIKIKLLKDAVDDHVANKNDSKVINAPEGARWSFPKGVDIERALMDGFYAYENNLGTGYYFPSGASEWTQQSNFIMKPLMHVKSKSEDKRMLEITNPFNKVMIDMPSRALISLEQFRGILFEMGNNLFFGTQNHLLKIWNIIGRQFEICEEMKTLGWQPEGFFAYSNGIVTADGFVPMDDRGIAEYNERKYYSPSASAIYKVFRQGDDEYANDRYLSYKTPPITFENWCQRMVKVYTESNSGIIGIAYMLVSLFRDVVFSIDNNSPHLSAYGEKGSGKSKFNESLSAVFFNDIPPLNLFHSTEFAFANRISRYSNCFVSLDEFNDATIREERFEQVKAGYDGIARERGKGGSKMKTEIISVRSSLGLAGQYLSTKDDNAALTRCIIIPFKKRSDDTARNNEEVKEYEDLKRLEKQGISGMLIEILKYRKEFEKEYIKMFPEQFAELRTTITEEKGIYHERVMRNYCALLTCIRFFDTKFKLPFDYHSFLNVVKREVIKLSTLINESDSLADFWNTIVYLMETGEIYDGFDLKFEDMKDVTLSTGHKIFDKPKKLLFLRLNTIHKLYMQACRSSTGKSGVNLSTIELYLTSNKGFLGQSKASRFVNRHGNEKNTSSYVFDYEMLNVPIQMTVRADDEVVLTSVTGKLRGDVSYKDVMGVAMMKYTLAEDKGYMLLDKKVESLVYYTCYDPDHTNVAFVTSSHDIVVTGDLKIKSFKNKEGEKVDSRVIEVKQCKMVSNQLKMDTEDKGNLPF